MSNFKVSDFKKGQRVELHPATSLWMMGARFGDVLSTTPTRVIVKLDKLTRPQALKPANIFTIVE